MFSSIKQSRKSSSRSLLTLRARPQLEGLESRVVPYTTSGNLWPNPQLVTISFVPDGTNLGGQSSNLFSTFNSKFGSAATWENVILKAAQQWALQTNLNFAVIADSGAQEGSGSYQQGDPTMGDIRIGGYNFGTSALAQAFMPPPVNNYSLAGDIDFNTGQTFNIGSTYDLFTVAMHEFGHALGMLHSTTSSAVMYSAYNGAKSGLTCDDIAGIRNIYSNNNPRSADQFGGTNTSFAYAADLTSQIDTIYDTLLVTGLTLNSVGKKEYYAVTAPSGTGSTVTIDVQSSGLSLLAPTLTVYASDQITVLGSASGSGQYGTTLTVNLSNVSAGQQLYVKVGGAESTALGTGTYALTATFAGSALPSVPLPNTQVANGNPLHGGGGTALVGRDAQNTQTNPLDMPQLTHGGGCNCPFCRGAAAAVQQDQLAVTGLEKIASESTNRVAATFQTDATNQGSAVEAIVQNSTSGVADSRQGTLALPVISHQETTSYSAADLVFSSDWSDACFADADCMMA
jgi:hypothetical protein